MNENSSWNKGLTQTITIECSKKFHADRVEGALTAIDGVRSADVDGQKVTVEYDPTIIDTNAIRAAIENEGAAPLAGDESLGGNDDALFSTTGATGERSSSSS
jgi:copper chaperone CopZ